MVPLLISSTLLLLLSCCGLQALVTAHGDHGAHAHDHAIAGPPGVKRTGGHECVHDYIKSLMGPPEVTNVSYGVHPLPGHRRFLPQQTTYANIRVTFAFDVDGTGSCTAAGNTITTFTGSTVTCTSDDVLTATKKDYITNVLMPGARSWIQSALKVVRVSGNLVVGGTTKCGSRPGITIPSADQSTGIANSDFHIYVTSVPMSDPNSATVAWAMACRDDSNGRAVVGQVNWVPSKLTNAVKLNAVTQAEDINTGIHELSHALGFSAPFFDSTGYLKEDGSGYVTSGGTTTYTDSTLGKSVTKIVSPRVLREAKSYFGCSSMDGVEIEDQGGSGTKGSHWEKRILYQEYMNGISSTVKSFKSALTLGFFEDTGHYQADYTAIDVGMNWGAGKGCTFLSEKCNSANNKASGEFCFETDSNKNFCTMDFLAVGMCDVATYSGSLPSYFQYFTDSTQGAGVAIGDYCPAVVPYSNTICTDPTNSDSQAIYGQTYSSSSRCFDSNLLSSKYVLSKTQGARCFSTSCTSSGLIQIQIDGTTVNCPTDGSAGAADLVPLLGSYKGYINCPKASLLCTTSTRAPVAATPSPPTTTGGSPASTTTTTTSDPASPPTPAGTPTPTVDCTAVQNRAQRDRLLQSYLPDCGGAARAVNSYFGTSCQPEMRAYLRNNSVDSDCESRTVMATIDCNDGFSGADALCDLLNSVASASLVLLVTVAASLSLLSALW